MMMLDIKVFFINVNITAWCYIQGKAKVKGDYRVLDDSIREVRGSQTVLNEITMFYGRNY